MICLPTISDVCIQECLNELPEFATSVNLLPLPNYRWNSKLKLIAPTIAIESNESKGLIFVNEVPNSYKVEDLTIFDVPIHLIKEFFASEVKNPDADKENKTDQWCINAQMMSARFTIGTPDGPFNVIISRYSIEIAIRETTIYKVAEILTSNVVNAISKICKKHNVFFEFKIVRE